jgi:N-acetylglucosamine-6-sulfatase
VVANIDVGPTILHAAGLRTPAHMDGSSVIPLLRGEDVPWRDYFLYVYYWEKNFPQSPTVFALRGDRYKYITYYGLWDTDELYDLQADPGETRNLITDPELEGVVSEMEDRLYAMLGEEGGMEIPLNQPRGFTANKRLGPRGGHEAADFPPQMVLEEPQFRNAQ